MGFFGKIFGVEKGTGQTNNAQIQSSYTTNNDEQAYIDEMKKRMMGQGSSAAELQMQAGQQEAFNQAQAMAASNRSVNPALAQRQAQTVNSDMQNKVNQQAGIMRAEEQAQATNQLGDFYNQLRNAKVGIATNNSLASQQVAANRGQLTRSLLSGGGQVGAAALMSDENEKENIEMGDKEIKSFLDAIKAYKYDYKDKKDGEGEFVSPMAQDLEKSKVGKKMVKNTPDGKMVEFDGHSLGSMLAGMGYMNKKVENIESKLENYFKNKKKGK